MNSECSDEPAHLHSITRVFPARIHKLKLHMRFCLVIGLYMYMFLCVVYSLNKSYYCTYLYSGFFSIYGMLDCIMQGYIYVMSIYCLVKPCLFKHFTNTSCNRYSNYCHIIWALSQQNLSMRFPTRPCSNQPPQLQRLARKLKSCLKKVQI